MHEPEHGPEHEEALDRARRNAADLVSGIVLVLLGLAVLYGSWTMPRLEERGVHPLTVPGLVPGLLALALLACGAMLAAGAWRGGELRAGLAGLAALAKGPQAGRVATAMVLVLVYTLGLVGWLPFWLATALFVFAFIVVFEVLLVQERPPLARTLAWAAGVAIVAGAGAVLVFERGFLVRLP
jgi:putative tricarboxylic transport membrane protein